MIISIKNNWENALQLHTCYLNDLICDFLNKKLVVPQEEMKLKTSLQRYIIY